MSSKRLVSLCVGLGSAALCSQLLLGSAQQLPGINLGQTLEVRQFGFAVRYPANWSATQEDGVVWIVNAPLAAATGSALDQLAQIYVTVEKRSDHAAAVQRLREIALEYDAPITYLSIGGWPALRRQVVIEREQPGEGENSSSAQTVLQITTAIAAGDLLIREEARMPPNISQGVQEEVRSIQAGLSFTHPGNSAQTNRELEELRTSPKPTQLPPLATRENLATALHNVLAGKLASEISAGDISVPTSGVAQNVPNLSSEPEVAVSTDGKTVVIAAQFNYAISTDGGQTFPTQGVFTATGATCCSTGGDSSLAFGNSGTFYEGTIFNSSLALNVLAPSSSPFSFRTNPFTCPTTGPNQCLFTKGNPPAPLPDQEHVGADRFNATSSGDQVYFVWRMGFTYGIACSTNSGVAFATAPQFARGDFPRITVGQDGSVYVVYLIGGNVELAKYSSCQSGLSRLSNFPITVATSVNVNCPVPGLDRCNLGNTLASPMVAVDDQQASVVYVSYALSTTPCGPGAAQQAQCNENILVWRSANGGQSFQPNALVANNPAVTARRFMPWICATHGKAWISWYDRRAANAGGATDDLTAYFLTTVQAVGSNLLTRGAEVNLSVTSDPQCVAGAPLGSPQSWPQGARAPGDAASCSTQPQIATGFCKHTPNSPSDTNQRCNSAGPNICPATNPGGPQTCQNGLGVPKYGDYNGSACASVGAGRVYNVWASATAPPALPTPTGIALYTSVTDASACGGVSQPCCANNPTCNASLACVSIGSANSVCSCGFSGQPCCQPGSSCSPGFSCDANSTCSCGGLGEPCCTGQQCGSSLTCSGKTFTCIQSCGNQGQSCCGGSSCFSGLTCAAGKCECGQLNEPCCLQGNSCNFSLTCANGRCYTQAGSCGQCNQQESSCFGSCGQQPAQNSPRFPAWQQCQCNCSNAECSCYRSNTCGVSCVFQSCGAQTP